MFFANFSVTDAMTTRQRNQKLNQIAEYDFTPYIGQYDRLDGTTLVGPELVEWLGMTGVSSSTLDLTFIEEQINMVVWSDVWIDATSTYHFIFDDLQVPENAVDYTCYEALLERLGIYDYGFAVTDFVEFLELAGIARDQLDLHEVDLAIEAHDWEMTVIDKTFIMGFMDQFGLDYSFITEDQWKVILDSWGIEWSLIDTNYVLGLLDFANVDTSNLNVTLIQEILVNIDWYDTVLDATAVQDFLTDIGVDSTLIDPEFFNYVLEELGIVYTPWDVHAMLNLLDMVGYDTSTVN
jgi:hypothetical protein